MFDIQNSIWLDQRRLSILLSGQKQVDRGIPAAVTGIGDACVCGEIRGPGQDTAAAILGGTVQRACPSSISARVYPRPANSSRCRVGRDRTSSSTPLVWALTALVIFQDPAPPPTSSSLISFAFCLSGAKAAVWFTSFHSRPGLSRSFPFLPGCLKSPLFSSWWTWRHPDRCSGHIAIPW